MTTPCEHEPDAPSWCRVHQTWMPTDDAVRCYAAAPSDTSWSKGDAEPYNLDQILRDAGRGPLR